MSIQQIGKHTYTETGYKGSNLGCIVTGRGLVLIDTPLMPDDLKEWGKRIRELGEPLYLINTHHHFDHLLGNGIYGARVIAHETETVEMSKPDGTLLRYFITSRNDLPQDAKEQILNSRLIAPDITFGDRLSLHLGDVDLELEYVGGHCNSCITIHVLEDNVLFTGDVLHKTIHPYMGQANFREWIKVLAAMCRKDYSVIVPGHGGLSGRKEVEIMLRFLRLLWNGVNRLYKEGRSRDEIVEQMHRHINYYELVPGEEHIQTAEFDLAIGRLYDEIAARKAKR